MKVKYCKNCDAEYKNHEGETLMTCKRCGSLLVEREK